MFPVKYEKLIGNDKIKLRLRLNMECAMATAEILRLFDGMWITNRYSSFHRVL
jgi:hypothetical protein